MTVFAFTGPFFTFFRPAPLGAGAVFNSLSLSSIVIYAPSYVATTGTGTGPPWPPSRPARGEASRLKRDAPGFGFCLLLPHVLFAIGLKYRLGRFELRLIGSRIPGIGEARRILPFGGRDQIATFGTP